MANSNTEHSIALRQATILKSLNKKTKNGTYLRFQSILTDKESIDKTKNLKIPKVSFIRKALKFLDEYGEIKKD